MKKVIPIILVSIFLISFVSSEIINGKEVQFTEFSLYDRIVYSLSPSYYSLFSIIGDARNCGDNHQPDYTSGVAHNLDLECSDAGCEYCLIDLFNVDSSGNWISNKREYKDQIQLTGSSNKWYKGEIYCCPEDECNRNSDCKLGSSGVCHESTARDSRISYDESSWSYCTYSSTVTKTCYYLASNVCTARTYQDSCPSSYQGFPVYNTQSECQGNTVNIISCTSKGGVCRSRLGDPTGTPCNGNEEAIGLFDCPISSSYSVSSLSYVACCVPKGTVAECPSGKGRCADGTCSVSCLPVEEDGDNGGCKEKRGPLGAFGCSNSYTIEEFKKLGNNEIQTSVCDKTDNCKLRNGYTVTCVNTDYINVKIPTILPFVYEKSVCLAESESEGGKGPFCVQSLADIISPLTKSLGVKQTDCQTNTIIFVVVILLLIILISRI